MGTQLAQAWRGSAQASDPEASVAAADFPFCSEQDLERRDAVIAASRSHWDQNKAKELSLGPTLGRKVVVSNFRSRDGLSQVPKLMITDSTGHKFMTLTEEDFDAIVENLPKIKSELFRYAKKLS